MTMRIASTLPRTGTVNVRKASRATGETVGTLTNAKPGNIIVTNGPTVKILLVHLNANAKPVTTVTVQLTPVAKVGI